MNGNATRLTLLILLLLLSVCLGRSEAQRISFGEELYVAGWLWRSDGLDTFCNTKYVGIFSEINPVWYTTAANGRSISGSVRGRVENWARKYGVKLMPTVQKLTRDNADPALATSTLDDANRAKHIAKIVSLVDKNNFDGIDIDYENEGLSTVDKRNFVNFIQELGTALEARNKLLSVCVYDAAAGLTWQDWKAMLNYVDSLKVMVYNFDVTANPKPGPISPLSFLERNLKYAAGLSGATGKIIIGLPFYGRDWVKSASGNYEWADVTTVYYTGSTVKNGIVNQTVMRNGGEPYFNYQDRSGSEHTVYFQDAQALAERLKLIANYRSAVKGVTFWDLGGEDPLSWNEVIKY